MNSVCDMSLVPLDGDLVELPESSYASEGTVAHSIFPKYFEANGDTDFFSKLDVPADMKQYVYDFCMVVETAAKKIGIENIVKIYVEKRFYYSDVLYGTPDIIILYVKNGEKRLAVFDLKYGVGVAVWAENNKQMQAYCECVFSELGWDYKQATLVIYQPRAKDKEEGEELDMWHMKEADIKTFRSLLKKFEKKAVRIINGEYKQTLTEVAGGHCRFCARKAVCESYATYAGTPAIELLNAMETSPITEVTDKAEAKENDKKQLDKNIREFSDDELDLILTHADRIRDRLKAVEAYASLRCFNSKPITKTDENGEKQPAWKTVAGRSVRKWVNDTNAIADALIVLGVEDPWDKKLKGLTAVESIIGKGKIDSFTQKTEPGLKLVSIDDPRDEVSNRAIEMLGDINSDNDGGDNAKKKSNSKESNSKKGSSKRRKEQASN